MHLVLPTAEEINIHDSLDERHACRMFLGKTVAEAETLFRENALLYSEDLLWMGPIAFQFYLRAFVNYLEGSASAGDSDAINCFVGLIEFRAEQCPETLRTVRAEIGATCRGLAANIDKFDAGQGIYGELAERLNHLARMLSVA